MVADLLAPLCQMLSHLLLWSFLSSFSFIFCNGFQCHTFKECDSFELISNNSYDIECWGNYACTDASRIQTNTSQILCEGSNSCFQALKMIVNGDGIIECGGVFSCAQVQLMDVTGGQINCNAEQSCTDSNIITDSNLLCTGLRSCHNTDVMADSYSFQGALAAQDATLRASQLDISQYSATFAFEGSESGSGAEIVCDTSSSPGNSTCSISIDCVGTGCNNLTLTCPSGNLCNYDIDCASAAKSAICPDGLDFIAPYYLPQLREKTFTSITNWQAACSGADGNILCEDVEDGQCSYLGLNSNLANWNGAEAICCLARESCVYSLKVFPWLSQRKPDSIAEGAVAFRGDGARALDESEKVYAKGGGDLYFSAAFLQKSVTFPLDVQAVWDFDVIAAGLKSLSGAKISYTRDVFCVGVQSCQVSQMYNVTGHIYGYAREALKGSFIRGTAESDIYCDGYLACNDIDVDGPQSITAIGFRVLAFATIRNISKSVVGYGYQAFFRADITLVDAVLASGFESLGNAVIKNVPNVTAYGEDCLAGSLIISNDLQGQTLRIRVNGTNTERFEVYCNTTDVCEIECMSPEACVSMRIFCSGTCSVDCNDTETTACPIFLPSPAPTMQPTRTPTGAPTPQPTAPTVEPTQLPTNMPSTEPTQIPSSFPTLPTIAPSENPTQNAAQTQQDDDLGPFSMLEMVLIIAVGGLFCLFFLTAFALMLYCRKFRKSDEQNRSMRALSVMSATNTQNTLNTGDYNNSTTNMDPAHAGTGPALPQAELTAPPSGNGVGPAFQQYGQYPVYPQSPQSLTQAPSQLQMVMMPSQASNFELESVENEPYLNLSRPHSARSDRSGGGRSRAGTFTMTMQQSQVSVHSVHAEGTPGPPIGPDGADMMDAPDGDGPTGTGGGMAAIGDMGGPEERSRRGRGHGGHGGRMNTLGSMENDDDGAIGGGYEDTVGGGIEDDDAKQDREDSEQMYGDVLDVDDGGGGGLKQQTLGSVTRTNDRVVRFAPDVTDNEGEELSVEM